MQVPELVKDFLVGGQWHRNTLQAVKAHLSVSQRHLIRASKLVLLYLGFDLRNTRELNTATSSVVLTSRDTRTKKSRPLYTKLSDSRMVTQYASENQTRISSKLTSKCAHEKNPTSISLSKFSCIFVLLSREERPLERDGQLFSALVVLIILCRAQLSDISYCPAGSSPISLRNDTDKVRPRDFDGVSNAVLKVFS